MAAVLGAALDPVEHRALDVEAEGVAELPGLGLVGGLDARAEPLELVAADAVALEVGEEVAQRLLADAPHPLRGELEAVIAALDVALVLHLLDQPVEAVDLASRVLTEGLRDLRPLLGIEGLAR